MVLCHEDITEDEINHVLGESQVIYDYFLGVHLLIWIISLYIIFWRKRKRRKHTFVKVMWILISIQEIDSIVMNYYLQIVYNVYYGIGDDTKMERAWISIIAL